MRYLPHFFLMLSLATMFAHQGRAQVRELVGYDRLLGELGGNIPTG